MISVKEIKKDIQENKNDIFKSFFPNVKHDFNFKKIKKFKKFHIIIVIGMGGSILGSKAIYSFLKKKIKKKFIFIDNLDQNLLNNIDKKDLVKALYIIISKSGNTLETIVNSSFFQKYFNKNNVIIISENKNNILSNFAKKKNYHFFKHNQFIGGRYSVFSEVGMLPAYLMGLNPVKFKKEAVKLLKNKKLLNSSLKILSKINKKNAKILIFLNYIPELNQFLYWAQQLIAESLGKNTKGFIPVISNAPKDHHSLLQLYLDGPKDKFFYIFSSQKYNTIKIKKLDKHINYLEKKTYNEVKISQKNALIKVLKNKKISFREIKIKEFNEKTLGFLFFQFIFETISLAKMIKVNPYDQPAVEEVKILTKEFLNSKKL